MAEPVIYLATRSGRPHKVVGADVVTRGKPGWAEHVYRVRGAKTRQHAERTLDLARQHAAMSAPALDKLEDESPLEAGELRRAARHVEEVLGD